MPTEIVFSPEAQADLLELQDYIAAQGNPEQAFAYARRIQTFCLGLVTFPRRGAPRDDIRPGLRVAGFRRRVTIAFHLAEDALVIDRILYAGREWPPSPD